jgi:hypothetical protein
VTADRFFAKWHSAQKWCKASLLHKGRGGSAYQAEFSSTVIGGIRLTRVTKRIRRRNKGKNTRLAAVQELWGRAGIRLRGLLGNRSSPILRTVDENERYASHVPERGSVLQVGSMSQARSVL